MCQAPSWQKGESGAGFRRKGRLLSSFAQPSLSREPGAPCTRRWSGQNGASYPAEEAGTWGHSGRARGGREVWQVEQDRDAEARRDDCAPVIRQGGEDPPRQT